MPSTNTLYTSVLFTQLTGIIIISVGATVQGVYHGFPHFLSHEFYSVPTLLIVIGTMIFFISFLGCCGAVKENYCMIISVSRTRSIFVVQQWFIWYSFIYSFPYCWVWSSSWSLLPELVDTYCAATRRSFWPPRWITRCTSIMYRNMVTSRWAGTRCSAT